MARLVEKIGQIARVETGLSFKAAHQQTVPPGIELGVQRGEELKRVRSEKRGLRWRSSAMRAAASVFRSNVARAAAPIA